MRVEFIKRIDLIFMTLKRLPLLGQQKHHQLVDKFFNIIGDSLT